MRRALLAACLALLAVAAPAAASAREVLVLGDSLAVGIRPHLPALLPGDALTWDVRSGRTTPQGLDRLRAARRDAEPDVVVVSLGTNDGGDPVRFAARVAKVLALVPADACVVWPDIHRPARKGPYAALNRVLRAVPGADPRVHVVRWREAVATGRVALPDGLHPDAVGYERRARMVAAAVRRCAVPA